MNRWKNYAKNIQPLCAFSKAVLLIGVLCAAAFYILALICYRYMGVIGDYNVMNSLYAAALETAPATLAASVAAALITDMIGKRQNNG